MSLLQCEPTHTDNTNCNFFCRYASGGGSIWRGSRRRTFRLVRRGTWELVLPRIQLHCDGECDGTRGFEAAEGARTLKVGYHFANYTCKDCEESTKVFALFVTAKTGQTLVRLGDLVMGQLDIIKLGEYPPFSTPVSKRIQKLLGKPDLELYRKGSRSEAQGLGVGAVSYFRRIVDNQWKLFVKEIREAAEALGERDLGVYDRALAEPKFSAAVEMLKDAIPPKLLILDNQNPLTLLYRPLSKQLHDLSDEECLQHGAAIRKVLTALLENIADVTKNQEQLKEAADRLRQL